MFSVSKVPVDGNKKLVDNEGIDAQTSNWRNPRILQREKEESFAAKAGGYAISKKDLNKKEAFIVTQ